MTLLVEVPVAEFDTTDETPSVPVDCFGPVEPFTKPKYLPIEPLRHALERRLAQEAQVRIEPKGTNQHKGAHEHTALQAMTIRLQDFKPGVSLAGCRKALERVLHPATTHIQFSQADAIALSLGYHPMNLWPEEW